MGITDRERERRQNFIGSSDVAAIVGLDKFKSAYDVWLKKTGKVVRKDISEPAEAGLVFEEALLRYTEKQLGKIKRNQRRAVPGTIIRTNIDAIVVESGDPIEAKTAGLYGPLTEEWGDSGTDQVPDRVICQAQIHIKATDKEVCHVSTFLGGRGFGLYQILRNDQLINALIEAAAEFWDKYILTDTPPEDSTPSLSLIRRVIRTPNKLVVFQQPQITAYQTWLAAKEMKKKAEMIEEAAKANVIASLGDAEAAYLGNLGALSFLESDRKGYTVAATKVRTLRTLKELPKSFVNLLEQKGFENGNTIV